MSKKAKLFTALTVITAIAVISGATILASAASGSQTDPLITLSYLNEIFKPQILTELGAEITTAQNELSAEIDRKISSIETSGTNQNSQQPDKADIFSVVTLSRNQSLICSVGTEVMLRIGTASGYGTAPALVSITDGTTLASGSPLVTNHMYLVTIEGNSVKANADVVKVLIRGNYYIA